MKAVYKRELLSCFRGMTGYLFTAFTLLFTGVYVMVYNLSGYSAHFEHTLSAMGFIYMILVPVLTMRTVAEERRQKTDLMLYALPLRMAEVVLGKYLALVTVLLIPVGVMALYPLVLSRFGQVNLLSAYNGLGGFFLLGAALLAIGLFISALTDNQVAAAVITLLAMLLLYLLGDLTSYLSPMSRHSLMALIGLALAVCAALYGLTGSIAVPLVLFALLTGGLVTWYILAPLPFYGLFAKVLAQISLFDRYYDMIGGVTDLKHILFFLSVIVLFVFLTVQVMGKRRWA